MLRVDRFVLSLALVGLLIGGCRTYGGYDSTSKTHQAMQRSVEAFSDELNRAEADFRTLADAAEESDSLQSLVDEYQAALDKHESFLEMQRRRVERLSARSDYRSLHRAFGATVTEQAMVEQTYQRVIRAVRTVVQGARPESAISKAERQYTIRPANFPSLWDADRLSMEQALRGL